MKSFAFALYAALCAGALAHPGHGLPEGGHWHASDAWGFFALAGVLGAALWWSRRK